MYLQNNLSIESFQNLHIFLLGFYHFTKLNKFVLATHSISVSDSSSQFSQQQQLYFVSFIFPHFPHDYIQLHSCNNKCKGHTQVQEKPQWILTKHMTQMDRADVQENSLLVNKHSCASGISGHMSPRFLLLAHWTPCIPHTHPHLKASAFAIFLQISTWLVPILHSKCHLSRSPFLTTLLNVNPSFSILRCSFIHSIYHLLIFGCFIYCLSLH